MKDRKIEVLNEIAQDMEGDARKFDGQPFNGKTVAEYFGNQGAAIAALANILKSVLMEGSELKHDNSKELTIGRKKVWEMVKEIEERTEESGYDIGACKATMIVNFGPEGKCRPMLIDGRESLYQMLVTVLDFYENKLKEHECRSISEKELIEAIKKHQVELHWGAQYSIKCQFAQLLSLVNDLPH